MRSRIWPIARWMEAASFSGASCFRLAPIGELDIDRQAVGPEPGLLDQPGAGLGIVFRWM